MIIFSDVSEMWVNKNGKEFSIADISGECRPVLPLIKNSFPMIQKRYGSKKKWKARYNSWNNQRQNVYSHVYS